MRKMRSTYKDRTSAAGAAYARGACAPGAQVLPVLKQIQRMEYKSIHSFHTERCTSQMHSVGIEPAPPKSLAPKGSGLTTPPRWLDVIDYLFDLFV